MDAETRQALEESIQHWEENLEHAKAGRFGDIDTTAEGCALCFKFYLYNGSCKGCPVAARTGKTVCRGSPYHTADFALEECRRYSREGFTPEQAVLVEAVEAVEAELEFLKSLRPPDE